MPVKAELRRTVPLFSRGILLITVGALRAIPEDNVKAALDRHIRGDWGDLDADDVLANNRALELGGRLFSAYKSATGKKFWVITEADRSQTTVLLPEDY